jgi:RNA polymerase-interacting CarD/CdnL/TRCF family regulator
MIPYYAVAIGDMTIWVPADDMLESRLRPPTRPSEFKKLMNTLSDAGEPLPDDRRERKTLLTEWLKDGRTESLIRVIRSICTYRKNHSLSLDEQNLLKRSKNVLIGEWSHALSISAQDAEKDLYRLLGSNPLGD